MKRLLIILSLSAIMLSATSCMRGGNADKGDDGKIGNDKHETTTDHKDNDNRPPVTTVPPIINPETNIPDTGDMTPDSGNSIGDRIIHDMRDFEPDDLVPKGIRDDIIK